jgi:hypothetical protein
MITGRQHAAGLAYRRIKDRAFRSLDLKPHMQSQAQSWGKPRTGQGSAPSDATEPVSTWKLLATHLADASLKDAADYLTEERTEAATFAHPIPLLKRTLEEIAKILF